MEQTVIITVDGPSGAGKGTLSHLLARHLGYQLLDSGALYRLVALAAQRQGIDWEDHSALARCARELAVVFHPTGEGVSVHLDGEDVSSAIRREDVGMNASRVASVQPVREALLQRQRDFASGSGLVADGRDMGTTVFPDADCKFFLTASAEARAERRLKQLQLRGETADLAVLAADIKARDERDQSRAVSPLKPADDAIVIDSTDLGISAVLEQMLADITSRCRS